MRQLYGTLVAALFLEVARQSLDAVNIALFLYNFIQHLRVLHRADGERRREIVGPDLCGCLRRRSKTHCKAEETGKADERADEAHAAERGGGWW